MLRFCRLLLGSLLGRDIHPVEAGFGYAHEMPPCVLDKALLHEAFDRVFSLTVRPEENFRQHG